MSQDYTHACERAELLGLSKPTEEEWRQTQTEQGEGGCDDDDGALQDLDYADEKTGRIGGGLDELNTILSTTQKKLNRFKNVCGSLGTLLKVKVSSRGGTPHHKPDDSENPDREGSATATDEVMTVTAPSADDAAADAAGDQSEDGVGVQPRQIDLGQKMGSHLDKLDSLITKAENAQYSMQHQTKQMRSFLKK